MRLLRLREQNNGDQSLGCGEVLHGRSFPTQLKGAAYKRYVRAVFSYGNEARGFKVRCEFCKGQRDPSRK